MSCVKQHNYVISLTRETKRRKHIEQEFWSAKYPFFIFWCSDTRSYWGIVAKKFNIILDRSSEAKLWDGEIGCALSHISLWNLAVEKNLDYINIFEDDIYLGENAKELLEVDYCLMILMYWSLKLMEEWYFARLDQQSMIERFIP